MNKINTPTVIVSILAFFAAQFVASNPLNALLLSILAGYLYLAYLYFEALRECGGYDLSSSTIALLLTLFVFIFIPVIGPIVAYFAFSEFKFIVNVKITRAFKYFGKITGIDKHEISFRSPVKITKKVNPPESELN